MSCSGFSLCFSVGDRRRSPIMEGCQCKKEKKRKKNKIKNYNN